MGAARVGRACSSAVTLVVSCRRTRPVSGSRHPSGASPGRPGGAPRTTVNPSSLNGSLPALASALPAPAGGAVSRLLRRPHAAPQSARSSPKLGTGSSWAGPLWGPQAGERATGEVFAGNVRTGPRQFLRDPHDAVVPGRGVLHRFGRTSFGRGADLERVAVKCEANFRPAKLCACVAAFGSTRARTCRENWTARRKSLSELRAPH